MNKAKKQEAKPIKMTKQQKKEAKRLQLLEEHKKYSDDLMRRWKEETEKREIEEERHKKWREDNKERLEIEAQQKKKAARNEELKPTKTLLNNMMRKHVIIANYKCMSKEEREDELNKLNDSYDDKETHKRVRNLMRKLWMKTDEQIYNDQIFIEWKIEQLKNISIND